MKADENVASESPFFRIANAVVTSGLIKIMTAVDIKVYLTLAQHANWRTGWAYPSIRRLRDLTGASLTSIIKAARRLVGFGLISAERNGRRFPQLDPRQIVYQVHRTPQASPDDRSSGKEKSTMIRKRDNSGKYCSSRKETSCSSDRYGSCSSGKEPNKISELDDLNENAGPKRPEPSLKRSDVSNETVKMIMKEIGPHKTLEYLQRGKHAIPPFVLAACEALSNPAEGGS
jgi:DNA-binding transcriptional MocR family regulator